MFRANITIKCIIMKDLFSKLGKTLTKAEQTQINGGVNNPWDQCNIPGDYNKWCCENLGTNCIMQ